MPRKGEACRDGGRALRIPIALLQQVALLLTAVLLIALQLVHAVPSLPALGILERRRHRSDQRRTHFSSPCLYSATEPLSAGLGPRALWNFKSHHVLACVLEETGQGNNHRTHRQVQELLFLVRNPSSDSDTLWGQSTVGLNQVARAAQASTGKAGKPKQLKNEVQATRMSSSLRSTFLPPHILLKYPQ